MVNIFDVKFKSHVGYDTRYIYLIKSDLSRLTSIQLEKPTFITSSYYGVSVGQIRRLLSVIKSDEHTLLSQYAEHVLRQLVYRVSEYIADRLTFCELHLNLTLYPKEMVIVNGRAKDFTFTNEKVSLDNPVLDDIPHNIIHYLRILDKQDVFNSCIKDVQQLVVTTQIFYLIDSLYNKYNNIASK